MLALPDGCVTVLHPLATLVCSPAWLKAQILLAGGILAPVQRTMAAALRVMGRSGHLDYARYHEVLNRSVWPLRQAARSLLMLQHLDQGNGPLVFGNGENLERRRGPNNESLGICRDAVRTSRSHLVRASGLWSWFGTHRANALPRLCAVPVRRRTRRRSWNGLCCAGNRRSPRIKYGAGSFRRCGLPWAWRSNASGRTERLPVLRQS